jgi:hypothetical protein
MAPEPENRLKLQTILEDILGTENVYFQPPDNISMVYPCIVYRRDHAYTEFADNNPYHHCKRYQVTVIDRDPDSVFPDQIADLPMCLFDRFYVADNLNHDVFNIYI